MLKTFDEEEITRSGVADELFTNGYVCIRSKRYWDTSTAKSKIHEGRRVLQKRLGVPLQAKTVITAEQTVYGHIVL